MDAEFPFAEHDLIMGFTLFTGAILRYGRITTVGVPTNPKKKPPAYLVNLNIASHEGMKMTMIDCTFSSRSTG